MNTLKKGQRNQNKARKLLEADGYNVEVVRHSRWTGDFFELFDIIAHNRKEWLLIQVKTNRCDKKIKDNIKKYEVPPTTSKAVWIFTDRQKVPKKIYL